MSMHRIHQCLWKPEQGFESPGTGVTDTVNFHLRAGYGSSGRAVAAYLFISQTFG